MLAPLGVEGVLALEKQLLEVEVADLLRHALELQAQLIEHDLERERRVLGLRRLVSRRDSVAARQGCRRGADVCVVEGAQLAAQGLELRVESADDLLLLGELLLELLLLVLVRGQVEGPLRPELGELALGTVQLLLQLLELL